MKRIVWLCSTIVCQGLWVSVFAASGPPIYVTNQTDNTVYRVDPETGQSFLVTPTPVVGFPVPPTIGGIELANETLAYTVGFHDQNVYSVNLETGASSRITQTSIGPPAGLTGIAIADSTTAYVVNGNDQRVYVVDLALGTHNPVSPPIVPPSNQLSDIVLNGNTGYVTDFFSPNIYVVDLSSGAFTTIATSISPSLGFTGIALSDGTAFVSALGSSFVGSFVYGINLATGENQLIATLPPNIDIIGLALVDDTLAYTAGASDNNVYAIHLKTGGYSLVTPTPVPGHLGFNSGIGGVAIFIPAAIGTQGLCCNLLKFADYLNANAPRSTLRLFNLLSRSDLTEALEAAMPARLGFATFAAQNGYLASSQTVTDHLHQRRFSHPKSGNPQIALVNIPSEELLVDASEENGLTSARERSSQQKNCKSQQPCVNEGFFTGWLTGFGEYAREKAQRQTPAFSASLGGAVLGLDYNCANDDVIGVGASYAYTHVNEDEGMGHANVNQGFLGVYSTLHAGKIYFDLGAWGGYYHTDNVRKISFPGFHKTADSSTHGWQAAPHFELGYDGYFSNVCRMRWFGVSPFLLADWVANWQHSFTEHGASPLNMHQNGRFSSLLRGETGLRFHEIVTLDCGSLIFQEKGSYAYQKMFHTGAVTALLVGVPSSFTVTTLTGAQNLGVVEFSMLFKPFKRTLPYVELRYQGEFGSRYQSHQGMLEIGKDF